MSTSAHLTFDQYAPGVSLPDWQEFCAAHDLAYSPQTVGQNVYCAGQVEVFFGDMNRDELPELPNGRLDFSQAAPLPSAHRIAFSTYFGGPAMPEVLRLAVICWLRFGGALELAPELRALAARAGAGPGNAPLLTA